MKPHMGYNQHNMYLACWQLKTHLWVGQIIVRAFIYLLQPFMSALKNSVSNVFLFIPNQTS